MNKKDKTRITIFIVVFAIFSTVIILLATNKHENVASFFKSIFTQAEGETLQSEEPDSKFGIIQSLTIRPEIIVQDSEYVKYESDPKLWKEIDSTKIYLDEVDKLRGKSITVGYLVIIKNPFADQFLIKKIFFPKEKDLIKRIYKKIPNDFVEFSPNYKNILCPHFTFEDAYLELNKEFEDI